MSKLEIVLASSDLVPGVVAIKGGGVSFDPKTFGSFETDEADHFAGGMEFEPSEELIMLRLRELVERAGIGIKMRVHNV